MKACFNPLAGLVLLLVFISCRGVLAVAAHVSSAQNGTNFTYTLFNDEPATSQECLNIFSLNPNAPFEVVSTPPGWTFVTDNFSYIDWFCIDPLAANPNDVAAGASLGGFSISSSLETTQTCDYVVTSWFRGLTNSGTLGQGSLSAPAVSSLFSTITNVGLSVTNTLQLTVLGIPSFPYSVDCSSNLADWSSLGTNAAPFTLTDTNGPLLPQRFYRAVSAFDPATVSGD